MIGKEVLRPDAKRNPLVPFIQWIAALRTLVDEDRLNRKLVVCLNQHVFRNTKSLRILRKGRGLIDRRAEIAGGSFSVLDRKPVVATFPFQALMGDPECVSIAGGNDRTGRSRAAFSRGEIDPGG